MLDLAALRMVRAALAHPETGVEAQLLALPLDGDDARPEPPAAILDATADDSVTGKHPVADWPLLVLACEHPAGATRAGAGGFALDVPSLLLGVAYATRNTAEAAESYRATSYTLAAAMRALEVGLFAPAAHAARRRGPVGIVQCHAMTFGPVGHDIPGGKVTGAILLDLHVRRDP